MSLQWRPSRIGTRVGLDALRASTMQFVLPVAASKRKKERKNAALAGGVTLRRVGRWDPPP